MTPSVTLPRAFVQLRVEQGRIAECHPQIELPNVAALLDGMDFEQVNARLKLIYSQCAEAQRWAAVSLLEVDEPVAPSTQAARAQALWLEWVNEHSWQMWRSAHHILPHSDERMDLLNQWRQELASLRSEMDSKRFQPYAVVEPISIPDLADWRDQWLKLVYEPLLEEIAKHDWEKRFHTETVNIKELESGPAHRLHMGEVSLGDRFEALWVEWWHAAAWATHPDEVASPLHEPGVVAAARGNLCHRCQWVDGLAGFYSIDIPTVATLESVSRSLIGQEVVDSHDWRRGLTVWLQSHAPCVEIEVEYLEGLDDA
ncbi:hypothetical protein [Ferrimonas lipolytica]|uniref:Uncharacterized protein n=1 Tax=Ferrimonas lipolytica TaxID=2724191 RepID=A0A6H1UCR2_9GAMM|nr:hypothetical protein [Ferrimonas lipolytica]QIZ76429.1 hypothetical protein HER31_05875 [Ferrimonas lipolytica]